MDVRMPDGTIVRGIPDGTTKEQVLSKYNQMKLRTSNPAEYDPSSPEWQAKYGATSGMSGHDKFMSGAGKAVVDMKRGLQQLTGFRSREQQDESNRLDAPLMRTGAGIAGNIAGNVATTLLPAGLIGKAGQAASTVPKLSTAGNILARTGAAVSNPQSIKAAAGAGAAIGAMQPVGTGDSRLLNAALGAGTGGATQGVVQAVGRVAQPIKNALSSVDKKAVETLESAGVALDAGQKSGSQRLMQLKRFLTDNPLTASGQVKQFEKTQSTFNRAALKTIGEDAEAATEDVMDSALTRIGSVFDDVAARNPVNVDDVLLDDLASISQQAQAILEGPQAAIVTRQVDEVIDKAAKTGAMDGKAYQNIKSTLDLIGNTNQPGVKHWSGQLRKSLDDALQRSASADDVVKLKEARKQYRNYLAIERTVSDAGGNISPSRLANTQNVAKFGGRRAMATGRGATDLMKLAKAGKRIIPERMPNSGTTPRGMLQAVAPAAAGGAYGLSQDGEWSDAAKFAALGIGLPYGAQRLMNSPAAAQYLTQGLQGPMRLGLLGGPSSPAGLVARQVPLAGLLALQPQQ